jgi:hypothetical protein
VGRERGVNGWMDGRMDEWMDGLMDGWIMVQQSAALYASQCHCDLRLSLWVDGGAWMGGWVDGWMDGWMDGRTEKGLMLTF